MIGNERFDNSTVIDAVDLPSDPHKAHQVAEASRIQKLVPSGIPKEVEIKVKRIQEVVGKQFQFHVIYGALEDLGYDEQQTVTYFLDKMNETPAEEPQEQKLQSKEERKEKPTK